MPAPPTHYPKIGDPKIGVIASRRAVGDFDETVWADGVYLRATPDETVEGALGRFLGREVDVIALVGDDAFIGEALSVYFRHFRSHPTPARFFAPRAGGVHTVADAMEAPKLAPRAFRRLKSALLDSKLGRKLMPTLKVSSSAEPAARYGFSFGAGLFYRLFEAYHRAGPNRVKSAAIGALASTLGRLGRNMVLEGGSVWEPERARVAIDGRPRGDSLGYLLASTLDSTWLGLDMRADAALSVQMGESGVELARQVATTRALPGFLRRQRPAEMLGRLHIDWSGGYVLDGELFEPSKPYVVQVKEGPMAHFVTV